MNTDKRAIIFSLNKYERYKETEEGIIIEQLLNALK